MLSNHQEEALIVDDSLYELVGIRLEIDYFGSCLKLFFSDISNILPEWFAIVQEILAHLWAYSYGYPCAFKVASGSQPQASAVEMSGTQAYRYLVLSIMSQSRP